MPKQRGRKSAASLETPRLTASVQSFAPAPDLLKPEAQALWRSIIASRPHNFFSPGDLPLLREYCQDVATLIPRINEIMAEGSIDLELLKARDGLVRQATSLAVKLRICVSSRTRPDVASMRDSMPSTPPPWIFGKKKEERAWYQERGMELPERLQKRS